MGKTFKSNDDNSWRHKKRRGKPQRDKRSWLNENCVYRKTSDENTQKRDKTWSNSFS